MSVKACGVEVSCEDTAHQIIPCAPNMCITPAAPSPLPMPYPVMGTTSQLDPGCEDTKVMGKKSLTTDGKAKQVNGNEAGTQKDIMTMKTTGKAWPAVGAPVVHFEGAMTCVTGSPGFTNTQ